MSDVVDGLSTALRGFLTIFTGSIAGRILAMLGRILIIRALPPNEFGVIVLAFTVASIVAELAVVGIPKGVARTWAQASSETEQRDVLKAGLIVTTVVGVLAAGLVYALRGTIAAAMGEPALSQLLGLFAAYVLIHPIALTVVSALRGLKQAHGATLANTVSPNTASLVVFVLFASGGLAYTGAVAYWLLLPVWTALVGVWYLSREIDLRRLFDGPPERQTGRQLVSFSWPLALQSGITLIMTQVDVLFVGYFAASSDVGLYKSVLPLAKVTLIFLFSFVFLYLPLATEFYDDGDFDSLRQFFQTSTKWIVFVTAPLTVFLAVFPADVIRVLYDAEYLGASTTLAILAVGLFVRVATGPNAETIQSVDRTRVNLLSGTAGLATNLLLNLLLVPRYGIAGAAIATVVGFGVYNAIEIAILYWLHRLQPFSTNLVKPVLVTAATGFGLGILFQGQALGLVHLAVIGLGLAAVQCVAIVLTRSLDPEDRVLVEQAESTLGVELGLLRRFIPD